jgi:hypothetical protein
MKALNTSKTADWFLPAGANPTPTGQLNCLYVNRVAIGGFSSANNYWSSTENDALTAYVQAFDNTGIENNVLKNNVTFRQGCVTWFRLFCRVQPS